MGVLNFSKQIRHDASPIWFLRSMRHSTLLSWLQNGQLKTVASFSWPLFGGGFAADFRFPIAPHEVPTTTQRQLEPSSSLDSQDERLAYQNNTQQRVATK
jgi:hypothetical protein